jgi:hypothetical protein
MIYHLGYASNTSERLAYLGDVPNLAGYCDVVAYWHISFEFISILQSVHIACHFVLQAFSCILTLRSSMAVLAGIWCVGPLLALLDLHMDGMTYDAENSICSPRRAGLDWLRVLLLVSSFMQSTLSYVVVLVHSCKRAPGSVQQRALRRAAVYPLIFAITYAPILMAFLDAQLWVSNVYMAMAFMAESSAGLFNAVAYACQGRYLLQKKEAKCDLEGAPAAASMVVEFLGAEVIEYFPDACSFSVPEKGWDPRFDTLLPPPDASCR